MLEITPSSRLLSAGDRWEGFAVAVPHGVVALKLQQSGDSVIFSFPIELQRSQRSGLLWTVMLNALQIVWFTTAFLHGGI